MRTVTTSLLRTAALAAVLLCPPAAARTMPPQGPRPPAAPAMGPLSTTPVAGRVCFDEAPDGTLWARGDDWKAAFDAGGFTFVPFLGSERPRSYPLRLSLAAARAGTAQLPLRTGAPARLVGQRVEIARGGLVEAYELRPQHVEQLFVIERPVGGGALELDLRVATELAGSDGAGGGHVFANEFGGVRYGRAVAIDARGRRADVASRLRGSTLNLTVPDRFVADAAFPLTIDPVVQTFSLAAGRPTGISRLHADCAYVGSFDGVYAAVYEEIYSATDHDVYLQPYDRNGVQGPGVYVDATSDYWTTPKVASHRAASQFLVVATRGLPLTTTSIWARTVSYATSNGAIVLTTGNQFAVHNGGSGKSPDVGGDPNASSPLPGSYCVTWVGQTDGELYYNVVHTDGTVLLGSGGWLSPGPEPVSNPAVSKSCGVGTWATRQWILVWQKRLSVIDEDIFGSVIGIDGNVRKLEFPIDTSLLSDSCPEVSSLTDPIDGYERFVVVYQRAIPPIGTIVPPYDIVVGQLFTGTASLSGPIDLSSLLQMTPLAYQRHPCVDTDGSRFAVGFSEDPSIFTPDVVPYLATVHMVDNTLGVTAYPEPLNYYTGPDDWVLVTSERSGGTSSPRYMATWEASSTSTGSEVHGAFYYGHTSLGSTSYFAHALAGCGGLTLTASGLPALASTFWVDLTGVQGAPYLMLGRWTNPIDLCPSCQLGIDPATMIALPTASLALTVPTNSSLIANQLAAQGIDLFATGGCASPLTFTLSDMIVITVL